jgi:hypothetical protein
MLFSKSLSLFVRPKGPDSLSTLRRRPEGLRICNFALGVFAHRLATRSERLDEYIVLASCVSSYLCWCVDVVGLIFRTLSWRYEMMLADRRPFSFVVTELTSVSLMLVSRSCCRRAAGMCLNTCLGIVLCLLPRLSVDMAPLRLCMCFRKNFFVCCWRSARSLLPCMCPIVVAYGSSR